MGSSSRSMPSDFNHMDVTDPSDFKDASGFLARLDTSLRCSICKDFFDGPVLLNNCGHSFCSLCIREALSAEQQCPSCRQPAAESHLKKNIALEDVVSSWRKVRSQMVAYTLPDRSLSNGRKRKRSPGPCTTPEHAEISLSAASPKISRTSSLSLDVSSPVNDVACPVCSQMIPLDHINRHLDASCQWTSTISESTKGDKKQWKDIFSSKGKAKASEDDDREDNSQDALERLPIASYDVLKDKDLRTLLKVQKLRTDGDRETMKLRHRRWVVMYNANLDRQHRCSIPKLRKELKEWEDNLVSSKGKEKSDKALARDTATYIKRHSQEFHSLVAEVRDRKLKREVNNTPLPS